MLTRLDDDPASTEAGPAATFRRDLMMVCLVAAALRLVAGIALSGTYDYDEFILLALSRQYAHGFVPYRDFLFFHPPGSLLLGRALDPLTSLWWPAGRVGTGLIDSATAGLTFSVGHTYLSRRAALAAGLSYAACPLTLIAGVRVGPDPLIAALGMAGLCLLLRSRSAAAALTAGGLLGLATGTKYTAVLLVPAYLLAAPRRSWATVLGGAGAVLLLLSPYLPIAHAVQQQTIVFQDGRAMMAAGGRFATTGLYWLAVTPLAAIGLARRAPAWVKAGFLAGGALLLAPQIYYHYFVLFAPFAALLSAPLLAGLRRPTRRILAVVIAYGLTWVTVVSLEPGRPLLVTAARLSDVAPTVALLRHETAAGGLVLADRYEYPFLAGRPPLSPYFWNVRPLVKGSTLQQQLPCASAVVLGGGASSGYPMGLRSYLDRHYPARRSGATTVWLLRGSGAQSGAATGFGFHPSCERFVLTPRQPCLVEVCRPGPDTDEVKLVRGDRLRR